MWRWRCCYDTRISTLCSIPLWNEENTWTQRHCHIAHERNFNESFLNPRSSLHGVLTLWQYCLAPVCHFIIAPNSSSSDYWKRREKKLNEWKESDTAKEQRWNTAETAGAMGEESRKSSSYHVYQNRLKNSSIMSKICRWEYSTHLYSAYPHCAADSTSKARVWGWERDEWLLRWLLCYFRTMIEDFLLLLLL